MGNYTSDTRISAVSVRRSGDPRAPKMYRLRSKRARCLESSSERAGKSTLSQLYPASCRGSGESLLAGRMYAALSRMRVTAEWTTFQVPREFRT